MLVRLMFSLLPFLLLTDGEPTGGEPDADADDGDRDDSADANDNEPLGEPGKAALDAERKARRKAEAERKAAQDALDAIEEERRKQADKKAKDEGKLSELLDQRDADLKTANDSLATATAELDQLRTYVRSDVDAVAETVKAAARDTPAAQTLMDFHPGEDAAIDALLNWTEKAKARLPELTAASERKPGNGPNPNPTDRKTTSEEDQKARAAMRPRL